MGGVAEHLCVADGWPPTADSAPPAEYWRLGSHACECRLCHVALQRPLVALQTALSTAGPCLPQGAVFITVGRAGASTWRNGAAFLDPIQAEPSRLWVDGAEVTLLSLFLSRPSWSSSTPASATSSPWGRTTRKHWQVQLAPGPWLTVNFPSAWVEAARPFVPETSGRDE